MLTIYVYLNNSWHIQFCVDISTIYFKQFLLLPKKYCRAKTSAQL